MPRTFDAADAMEARKAAMLPLLIGLCGPSGSGKTYSALRIATGIREVVGGEIFVIDTEQRRSLHYADKFRFKHVAFSEPFGALDYLEALRFAKKAGAGVVVIDSCSHEHDGPGGLLEQHDAELEKMAGGEAWKREKMQMLAWSKPKAGRRKLIAALTSELNLPTVFCFRSKNTTRPMEVEGSNGRKKTQPVNMGFTTIGADEWIFEMLLSALLLPGSMGVPTWDSDKPGEKLAIKIPQQFLDLTTRNQPLDESIGRKLALWAKGDAPVASHAANPADAPPRASVARQTPQEWVDEYCAKVANSDSPESLAFLQQRSAAALAKLAAAHPDLHEQALEAASRRLVELDGPYDDATFPGDLPIDDEVAT